MIIIGVIMHHHSCGGRPLSPTKRRRRHHHQPRGPLNHHYVFPVAVCYRITLT